MTEAVLGNTPTDGAVDVGVEQWHSEVTVKQHPLVVTDLHVSRAGVVLHRTAPVKIVHVFVQGRLLHIGEVGDRTVHRVILGAGGDGVGSDLDAHRLAAVDLGCGGCWVTGRCGGTLSTAVGRRGRPALGRGTQHCDVAARVTQVNGSVELADCTVT